MKKNTGFNNDRKVGIEIEFHLGGRLSRQRAQAVAKNALVAKGINCQIEGYNHETRDHWKIVYDSSVNHESLELVSPPLKGSMVFDELKKVAEALDEIGAKVDKSCGLHIHHDFNDAELDTFKNIYGIFARYEDAIDELVAPSRRGMNNRYCKSPRINLRQLEQARSIMEITNEIYTNRFVKLNCQSYRRHGTIEFRNHQGTVEYEKIANWIVLTQMIVERAFEGKVKLNKKATDWFNLKKVIKGYGWMGADNLQQNAVSFFNKRRNHFIKRATA